MTPISSDVLFWASTLEIPHCLLHVLPGHCAPERWLRHTLNIAGRKMSSTVLHSRVRRIRATLPLRGLGWDPATPEPRIKSFAAAECGQALPSPDQHTADVTSFSCQML